MDQPSNKRPRGGTEGEARASEDHDELEIKPVREADERPGGSTASNTTATSPHQHQQQPKEQRSVQACSRCRRLKSKCIRPASQDPSSSTSGSTEVCRGCQSAGVPCVFDIGPPSTTSSTSKRARSSRDAVSSTVAPVQHHQQSPVQQQSPATTSYSIPSGLPSTSAAALQAMPFPAPAVRPGGPMYGMPEYQQPRGSWQGYVFAPPAGPAAGSSGVGVGALEGRVGTLESEMTRLRAQMDGWGQAMMGGGAYGFPGPSTLAGATGGLWQHSVPQMEHGPLPAQPSSFGLAPGFSSRHQSPHSHRSPQTPRQELGLPQLPSSLRSTAHSHHDDSGRRSLPPPPTLGSHSVPLSPRQTHTADGSYGYRRASETGAGPSTPSQLRHELSLGISPSRARDVHVPDGARHGRSIDLLSQGIVDEETARITLEFYISDLALHTPYITFLPTPVTFEHVDQMRASSSLLFNAHLTITLRALDQSRYDAGMLLVRRDIATRLIDDPGAELTTDDLKGLVLFSIWQADPSLTALSVQLAHTLGLHTTMQRYISLLGPFSAEGTSLMDLARVYASLYVHEHLLEVFNNHPPLMSHSITALWQACCQRGANANGVDAYITSYLLFADLMAIAQSQLFIQSLSLPTRLAESARLHTMVQQWHTTQHAADSLITILPVSFATVYLFSPMSYATESWDAVTSLPEGARQIAEATEASLLLLDLLMKTWRDRPMVRYTRDLHGFILGLSLAHLLGTVFCCPTVVDEEQEGNEAHQGQGSPVAREKLRSVLRTWEGFGLETEGSLLGRILDELDGHGGDEGATNAGWEELRAKRWGRDMWEAIVPSGKLRREDRSGKGD